MAREKSAARVSLEYYPVRYLSKGLGLLPWRLGIMLSYLILRAVLACLPGRRKIADDNVAQAFPAFDASARRRVVRHSVFNLASGAVMFSKMTRLGRDEWNKLVRLEGFDYVREALSRGRGAIAFTAHYGCWEAMSVYVSRLTPAAIVARPLDNPRLDELVSAVRAEGGGKIIAKRRALAEGLKALRENRLLGILIDQNFAPGILFVDFFGKPASTTPIVSLLARRAGCAVLPLHNAWEDGRLRIIVEPPLPLSQNPDRHAAVAEDTQAMTKVVERWIRENPSQWLWLHNRWKRRPDSV